MKISTIHPDNIGATFSTLCVIHCFATPFLFITQSYMIVVPGWWQVLNYVFLAISFFAVYRTSQNSSSQIIKTLLFVFWGILATLLISEEFELFHLPEFITYLTGLTLAGLHIYNKKHCQCVDDECCVD